MTVFVSVLLIKIPSKWNPRDLDRAITLFISPFISYDARECLNVSLEENHGRFTIVRGIRDS